MTDEYITYNNKKPVVTPNEIRNKVIGQGPGDFIPELSPNYNPNTGRIELNSKPVGIFEPSKSSNRIATRWDIKD